MKPQFPAARWLKVGGKLTPERTLPKSGGVLRSQVASSFPRTSPSSHCRQNAPSSIRSRTSGNSCDKTGYRTASSNRTTASSTTALTPGTSSSNSLGALCPSVYEIGPTGHNQRVLVLYITLEPERASQAGAHASVGPPIPIKSSQPSRAGTKC